MAFCLINDWYKYRKWVWLIAALPASAIIIWPESRWINVFVIAWIGIIWFIYNRLDKKLAAEQLHKTIKSNQKMSITTMNHYRHDWMNQLQVLFGYISLGKKEKCIEYVEKIKGRMFVESQIAKLEEPGLVSYLQAFRIFPAHFELEVKFVSECKNEHYIDDQISELIIAILNLYRRHAVANARQENVLTLTFDTSHHCKVHFLYKEQLQNIDIWQCEIEKQAKELVNKQRLVLEIKQHEVVLQILA